MKHQKLKAFALTALLLVGSLSQIGCGNTQTIDKVGRVAVALAQGFADQVAALKAGGLTGAKIESAEAASKKITAAAASLKAILDGAKTINEKDAAEIARYIATITATVGGLLQNPDFTGLGDNTTIVKITKYTAIALNQLSLTLTVFFPPPPPGAVVAASGGKTVATAKIKIEFPEPPAEVKALLEK